MRQSLREALVRAAMGCGTSAPAALYSPPVEAAEPRDARNDRDTPSAETHSDPVALAMAAQAAQQQVDAAEFRAQLRRKWKGAATAAKEVRGNKSGGCYDQAGYLPTVWHSRTDCDFETIRKTGFDHFRRRPFLRHLRQGLEAFFVGLEFRSHARNRMLVLDSNDEKLRWFD